MKIKQKRDYANYDRSQVNEASTWFKLISRLVEEIEIYKTNQYGRTGYDKRDMLICCSIKQYFNFSYRRTLSLIKLITGRNGDELPCFKTIRNYMTKKETQKHIQELIQLTSIKLKIMQNRTAIDLAVDSTGFTLNLASKWYGRKIGQFSTKRKEFRKLHVASDMLLNSITACIVSDAYEHDHNFFEQLVRESGKVYKFKRVFGDAAYCSRKHCNLIKNEYNAEPYLKPKKSYYKKRGSKAFKDMLIKSKTEQWHKTYVLRERVEGTISAIKRLFNDKIRSKEEQGRINEVLMIALNYNITIMVKAIFGYEFNVGLLHNR